MKKFAIGFAVLFSSTAQSQSFLLPQLEIPRLNNVTVPSFKGGIILQLSGLYLKPSIPNLDYVVGFPYIRFLGGSVTNPTTVFEDGTYRSVDPQYEWGFESKVGYEFPNSGNDVMLGYRYLNTSDQSSRRDPAMIATMTGPNAATDSQFFNFFSDASTDHETSVAAGENILKYSVADLDFGQHFNVGYNANIRLFLGLRYFNLNQHFNAIYTDDLNFLSGISGLNDFSITRIRASQKSRLNGIGPRLGADLGYLLGYGFSVVGHSAAALIIADSKTSFSSFSHVVSLLTNGLGVQIFQDVSQSFTFHYPSETRIVPNIDLNIGFSFAHLFRNDSKITLEVGWMDEYYWNSLDRLSEQAALEPSNGVRKTITTSFDGPYVKIQVAI